MTAPAWPNGCPWHFGRLLTFVTCKDWFRGGQGDVGDALVVWSVMDSWASPVATRKMSLLFWSLTPRGFHLQNGLLRAIRNQFFSNDSRLSHVWCVIQGHEEWMKDRQAWANGEIRCWLRCWCKWSAYLVSVCIATGQMSQIHHLITNGG